MDWNECSKTSQAKLDECPRGSETVRKAYSRSPSCVLALRRRYMNWSRTKTERLTAEGKVRNGFEQRREEEKDFIVQCPRLARANGCMMSDRCTGSLTASMTDLKLVRRWACVDRTISTLLTDSQELDVKWRAHIMSETAKDSMERWNTYRVVRGNLWGCDGRFSNSGSDVSNRKFMGMTDGKRA